MQKPEQKNQTDQVRVLRLLEYTGPRAAVEAAVKRSLHGERTWEEVTGDRYDTSKPRQTLGHVTCRAATLGEFAEIIKEDAITDEITESDMERLRRKQ